MRNKGTTPEDVIAHWLRLNYIAARHTTADEIMRALSQAGFQVTETEDTEEENTP